MGDTIYEIDSAKENSFLKEIVIMSISSYVSKHNIFFYSLIFVIESYIFKKKHIFDIFTSSFLFVIPVKKSSWNLFTGNAVLYFAIGHFAFLFDFVFCFVFCPIYVVPIKPFYHSEACFWHIVMFNNWQNLNHLITAQS